MALSGLAWLYEAQGKYDETLAALEKARGPDHPGLPRVLNKLAELYRVQGRHAEAEPLYKRSLAIQEKAHGPDHVGVATILDSFAMLLRETDRATEAEKIDERARAIRIAQAPKDPNQVQRANRAHLADGPR
jgi:tetratricopeptide (TPR) repeat protein